MGFVLQSRLVDWEFVILFKFNQALLGKWMRRFSQECDALWRSVIDVKYGSVRGGWSSLPVMGSYGVSVWKFIRRWWDNVAKYLRFEVGDGSHIRFWHDL
jgi:hypothetical protein